ncbi:sensor histidine kinase, partial [Streptomyces sp. NPDC059949]
HTNVNNHAPRAPATVRAHYGADVVHVRDKDGGSGRPAARTAPTAGAPAPKSTGQGLIGMRERATIYQGTVTAEPAPEGGFEVSLRVPVPRGGGDDADAVRTRRR